MAEMEAAHQQPEPSGAPDIVVGVAGAVAADELRVRAEKVVEELSANGARLRVVFARPGREPEQEVQAAGESGGLTLMQFAPTTAGGEFWRDVSASQRAVLALAAGLNARACIVLGADLAALNAPTIRLFLYAILERQCALAMPVYPAGKYDGLINSGILSPLSRALFGKRVRYPLAFDFAASGAMSARLARFAGGEGAGSSLLWPVAAACVASPQTPIGQVAIDARHQVATGGLELSAVLGALAGSLFREMEESAAHWQRVRGSQPAPVWGNAHEAAEIPETERDGIDTQPMLDSFLLGSKNLDEVWRLVLPPNTLLELRRLTRMKPEEFRVPDDLWAGIVYDFALAWRLRTMSRVHLLGALTPLYLGWVASYLREAAKLTSAGTEQRLEQFARAWEEKKPYLLSRWRWPDRFNP